VNAAQVVGAEHTPVALLERFEDVERFSQFFVWRWHEASLAGHYKIIVAGKYKYMVLHGCKSIVPYEYKYIMLYSYKSIVLCKCKYIMLL
jgi:hypothetical protein